MTMSFKSLLTEVFGAETKMLAEAFGPPTYEVVAAGKDLVEIRVFNGYAIKDGLKALGFHWYKFDKQWRMLVSPDKSKVVVPKLQDLIYDYHKRSKKPSPQAAPVSQQDLAAMHVHIDKAKKVFKKFDIDVYIVPGGAHGQVLFKGKTFDHKHLWKAAGFHWSGADKGWAMPAEKYAPITRKINQQLLKALHKAES